MKKFVAIALMTFAFISLAVAVRDILRGGDGVSALSGEPDGVYTVLFRGSSYCPTCDTMEELARELLASYTDRDGARVPFLVVNYEKPENEHYLFDYDLYTTTVVLIEQRNGREERWKNLQDSWEYAEKKGGFKEYLARELADFQEKKDVKDER